MRRIEALEAAKTEATQDTADCRERQAEADLLLTLPVLGLIAAAQFGLAERRLQELPDPHPREVKAPGPTQNPRAARTKVGLGSRPAYGRLPSWVRSAGYGPRKSPNIGYLSWGYGRLEYAACVEFMARTPQACCWRLAGRRWDL